ncbi:MAG: ECF-type sigma factor [Planctomycetota bacterium]
MDKDPKPKHPAFDSDPILGEQELGAAPPSGPDGPDGLDGLDGLDGNVNAHYDALRALAYRAVSRLRGAPPLPATDLVHEGYLRLRGAELEFPERRTEFLALASTVLRNCLVDQVRERNALKRGGDFQRVTMSGIELTTKDDVDLLELNDALERLALFDARQARIVELRFFGELSVDAIAELLQVSARAVRADWTHAKAWLHRELEG